MSAGSGPGKAEIWRGRLGDGSEVVVKDFSRRSAPWRAWGRVLVRRERSLLRRLDPVPEVPSLCPGGGGLTLAQDAVEGEPLFLLSADEFDPADLQRLQEVIGRVHRLGVVHNDLRARDNTLIDRRTGQLHIVDWAAGLHLTPGSVLHRLVFPKLRLIDLSALAKWRSVLAPETLSEEDVAFMERFRRWRRLWPVNRKGFSRRLRS